jgi:hypothetical protein
MPPVERAEGREPASAEWTCRCGHTHLLRGALFLTCPTCGCKAYVPTAPAPATGETSTFPRRHRMLQWTPGELAIQKAVNDASQESVASLSESLRLAEERARRADALLQPDDDLSMNDCLQVLCRVFPVDDAWDEWLAWYRPAEWLHVYRALGAFIFGRLKAERMQAAENRALAEGKLAAAKQAFHAVVMVSSELRPLLTREASIRLREAFERVDDALAGRTP